MPTFCRHNRLIQNCPICSREQAIELRPILSSSAPRSSLGGSGGGSGSRTAQSDTSGQGRRNVSARGGMGARSNTGLRVRKLARGADDGYQSALVPGLKSSEDAERLAEELAFAALRCERLSADPPGLYAEVADVAGDVEERSWLAFLIAYLWPLDDEEPFAAIARARRSWASGEPPDLDGVQTGARTAYDPSRGLATIDAYRAWAGRSGSQAAAFTGELAWTPERRFERAFERLALPGFHRDARFDLLATLGLLGVYELKAGTLALGGDNETTVAAKRALGIGDSLLLERRAVELATACELPLEALDLGLYNWGRGERTRGGLEPAAEGDAEVLVIVRSALSLPQ